MIEVMTVEIVVGQQYRNRRGEYEVLEVTDDGRLKVRYLQDGALADLDVIQQLRILTNMETEAYVQAQAIANAKLKPAPRATAAAKSSRSTTAAASPKETSRPTPASRVAAPVNRWQTLAPTLTPLKPLVPVRHEFTKLEVLSLLKFIGFGRQDARFWFIGNQDIGPSEGAVVLSERTEEVEFHKEYTDATIYKDRYRTETTYPYGSPAWQYINYLVSRLVTPASEQTDEGRQAYFRDHFGATEGDVLLVDTTSLPARQVDAENWPYRDITITDSPRYNSTLRDPKLFLEDPLLGQETRYKRLNELYEGLKAQQKAPRCVFCFGRVSAWRGYKEIFPNVHNYNDLELRLSPDRDRTARLSLGQDDTNGSRILLLPPLNPQDGMTYHYLDQLVGVLLSLKVI